MPDKNMNWGFWNSKREILDLAKQAGFEVLPDGYVKAPTIRVSLAALLVRFAELLDERDVSDGK